MTLLNRLQQIETDILDIEQRLDIARAQKSMYDLLRVQNIRFKAVVSRFEMRTGRLGPYERSINYNAANQYQLNLVTIRTFFQDMDAAGQALERLLELVRSEPK